MPARVAARRRLVAGGLAALMLIVGAAAWPLIADPNLNPADVAESEKARELLAPASPVTRRHGPSDRELGDLREKLDKKIRMDFTDASTLEVMNKLLRETGIPFVIDNLTLLEGDGKVTIIAPAMSIRSALSQACDSFTHERGDWCIVDGTIVVSSARQVAVRTCSTRQYDIRHLLIQVPNFSDPPSLNLDQSLSNTSSGGSAGGAATAMTLFEDDGEGYGPSREEIVEGIATLIMDTIGEQSEWQAYGGELSSLRELNGKLIIKTSSRNHESIQALLDDMGRSLNEMIHVEARSLIVKTSVLDQIKADNDGELIFDAKGTDELLKKLGEDKTARRVAMGRYMMRNGQRAHMAATLDKAFLSDVEPVSGTGGADPTLSTARNGMVIDAETSAAPSGEVIMTLRVEISTGGTSGSSTIPIGPGYPSPNDKKKQDPAASVGPDPGDAPACGDEPVEEPAEPRVIKPRPAFPRVAIPKAVVPAAPADEPPAPPAPKPAARPAARPAPIHDSATLATPSHDIYRVSTSVTLPSNGAAVFSGSSKEQSSIADDYELIVIIRAKASGNSTKKNAKAKK